jgi:hypothetical protein
MASTNSASTLSRHSYHARRHDDGSVALLRGHLSSPPPRRDVGLPVRCRAAALRPAVLPNFRTRPGTTQANLSQNGPRTGAVALPAAMPLSRVKAAVASRCSSIAASTNFSAEGNAPSNPRAASSFRGARNELAAAAAPQYLVTRTGVA